MKRLIALMVLAGLASAQLRVGIAFDVGGKNDPTFNGVAYAGAQRGAQQFKGQLFDFEPGDPAQVGQGVRKFAEEGFDLIIGVGFATEGGITSNAKEFKDRKFALIDSVSDAPNVQSLVFRENEGTYLVGYIAGRMSQTGVVGFVGGMDIPLIHKFEVGYREGVKKACPNCRVVVNYVGNTPAAFNDPAKGKEIANFQRTQGADIIYAAAGASGLGVFNLVKEARCLKAGELPRGVSFRSDPYAKVPKYAEYSAACGGNTRPMFFIGGDGNLNFLGDTDNNPDTLNHAITCMLKKVDVAAFKAIEAVSKNTFKGGIQSLGLKEAGLDFALDKYNRALLSDNLEREVRALKSAIISGKIGVPDKR